MPLSGPLLPRGARLFITGGTGFVGRSLLKFLNDPASGIQDVKVPLLTRNPERYAMRYPDLARGVELLRGDICDFAWPAATFSHVIHAAADTSSDAGNRPLELMQTIVDGTARVLDFAFSYKANKVLFLSSGAIYGRQPAALEQIPEEYSGELDPNEPASAYGNAKRLAEQLCTLAARRGLAVQVARLFAFVGEDLPLDAHYAIGNFIRDALAGGPIEVKGDGSPIRSYLYQGDLARWLVEILQRAQPGRSYNVGSDEAVSIGNLAQLVADVVAPGAEVRVTRQRADYSGRLRYVPSIQRARNELGLAPLIPLADAIRRTAEWHRR